MDTKHFTTEFQDFWKAELSDGTATYHPSDLSRSAVSGSDDKIVNVVKVRGFGLYDILETEPKLVGVYASLEDVAQHTKTVNEPTASATTNEDTPNDGDKETPAKFDQRTGSRFGSKIGSTSK